MTLAEHVYRALLWLYPREHRHVYEEPMLQHARDLGRVAQQRGPWHVAILCSRLLRDGVVNAAVEHMEAIGMADNRYSPVPWQSVILQMMYLAPSAMKPEYSRLYLSRLARIYSRSASVILAAGASCAR